MRRTWILSHVRRFANPWTVARQAPLFIQFSRQEYWSGLPFPPPGDLLNPGKGGTRCSLDECQCFSRSGSSSTRRKKTKLVLKIQSEMKSSLSVVSNSLQPHGLQPHQAPLSMEFSRQEYWSELPFPSPKGAIKLPHCLLSPELTNSLNSLNHEQSPKTTDKVYSLIWQTSCCIFILCYVYVFFVYLFLCVCWGEYIPRNQENVPNRCTHLKKKKHPHTIPQLTE